MNRDQKVKQPKTEKMENRKSFLRNKESRSKNQKTENEKNEKRKTVPQEYTNIEREREKELVEDRTFVIAFFLVAGLNPRFEFFFTPEREREREPLSHISPFKFFFSRSLGTSVILNVT